MIRVNLVNSGIGWGYIELVFMRFIQPRGLTLCLIWLFFGSNSFLPKFSNFSNSNHGCLTPNKSSLKIVMDGFSASFPHLFGGYYVQ